VSTSARSLGDGRENGKSSRKSADVNVDTGEKYQKDSNSIGGVLLPKEEKGTAGLLEVKHPQQNIREFSLCQDTSCPEFCST